MSDLKKVFDLNNLKRAYRWILSNPDAHYKSYFRDSYDAFAIASDTHLKFIRMEGLKERYRVSHASKVYLPKPSGVLRPITLLTVEDQIVYQACVNFIAEALKKKTRNRYETQVFAHLYASKSSPFFYLEWKRSYRKFSNKVRDSHSKGYEYVANFDLTSFYDSIDHHVLAHFLKDIGIDEDMIIFLMDCLKVWTSTTWSNGAQSIYHGHGIPQGPLSSGMLSEAVLRHIDDAGEKGKKTIYLRYVDDIKILARTEEELRGKLIDLDISSKEIGLFPQTSKINIRKITDPNEEIKSISRPLEGSVVPVVNQIKLEQRILELTRNGRVDASNSTRFKYLLGQAIPNFRLSKRLLKVLQNQPEYFQSISSYLSKYKRMPKGLAASISVFLQGPELYQSVFAQILDACLGKFPSPIDRELGQKCADRLNRPSRLSVPIQPVYKQALMSWALCTNSISFAEYDSLISNETDWWARKSLVKSLDEKFFGKESTASLLNNLIRAADSEVARVASSQMLQGNLKLEKPYGDVETTAKQMLKAAKIIRVVGQPASRISEITAYVFKATADTYDWKTFFGKEHRQAELMMIFLKRNFETNMDAFLVQLDSYCDLLTSEIYRRHKPGKNYPNYGSALKDPNMLVLLPRAIPTFLKLHDLRLQSATSHPRSQKTGKPTRRLKHSDYRKIQKELVKAFAEIRGVIVP